MEQLTEDTTLVSSGIGRIRPRARLLRTIGAELISSEVVAVIELVRNCYDADGQLVDLIFQAPHAAQATLEIRDDGHGMTKEILLGPWLEPATAHKVGAGARSPAGRRRLGSKGVGRFAAQRLGDHLTVLTRAGETELRADFDWSRLDTADRYLDQLKIPWQERSVEGPATTGTILRIEQLKDSWTADRFERLKLGLSRLMSPNRDERDTFRIRLQIDQSVEEIRPALESTPAMYSIQGSVQTSGEARLTYRDLTGCEEDWHRTVFWPQDGLTCGPFSFQINAWDLDREPLKYFLKRNQSPYGLRDFRRLIRDHSGVSLYRDGFRILPYGESDNDWLRLDRRRVNNPTMRFSNNQIYGWLLLGADENAHLRDQTNREGLVDNEAYTHLQRVVLELLSYFESRRFQARRSLDITWSRRSRRLPEAGGADPELDAAFDGLASANSDEAVAKLRRLLDERKKQTADVVAHYASLATVGQLSGMVFEQLDHPIRDIESTLRLLEADLVPDLEDEQREDANDGLTRIRQQLDRMRNRMERLDPLAVGRKGRRMEKTPLHDLARRVVDAFESTMDARGVRAEISGDPIELETIPALAQQALANLLKNAIEALESVPSGRLIRVRVNSVGYLVENNGPAIPENVREHIFDPHFTTKDGASGLGLTLAAELMLGAGGHVRHLANVEPVTFQIRLK